MELTSPLFFYFLALIFLLYWAIPSKFKPALLLLASYAFYAFWDLRFLFILIGSTAFDFYSARQIGRSVTHQKRKAWLVVSVCVNVLILATFKYFNFFLSSAQTLAQQFGWQWQGGSFEIFIPLGISFFTFHSISYVVDIYRRTCEPIGSLLHYALYVSYFPKLISGPIERSKAFLLQITEEKFFRLENTLQAMRIFLFGLFLKLCVSDRLAHVTTRPFSNPKNLSQAEAWIGFYAYSAQIYADFLGYTLIATGASLFFGIRLSRNFNSPYLSSSPQEFWRRWHITLSNWFRDYVYLPLGGEKKFLFRNIMITMVLAGLWHGASGKFLVWGAYHGLLLCVQRAIGKQKRAALTGFSRWIGIFFTFHLVGLGWILFRAKDLSSAGAFLRTMSIPSEATDVLLGQKAVWGASLIALWVFVGAIMKLSDRWAWAGIAGRVHWGIPVRGLVFGIVLGLILVMGVSSVEPFIYYYF